MEGKRIVIDGELGHTRSRTFAILIVVGLLVVAAVWYLQLRTMVREARLSEAKADFAALEDAMRASFESSTGEVDEVVQEVIPADVVNAIADSLAEERAKDAVAEEVTEAFGQAAAEVEVINEEVSQEPSVSATP